MINKPIYFNGHDTICEDYEVKEVLTLQNRLTNQFIFKLLKIKIKNVT